jgi:hypothetical protein
MGVPFLDPGPMTAEDFFAFTAARPDEEKWELVSYDRSGEFAERRFKAAEDALDLQAIGARLSLRDIYRDTGLL